ncbi:MAG: DUF3696 domain-containing protein [Myxococcales bacterium]|nr:DUF3696 domain-containing protein [Myxococcales bacterium]
MTAYYQNAQFAADLVLEIERLRKGIHYVGPLREHPKRLYLWSGEVPDHVGVRGERAVEAILASRDRGFNWGHKERRKTLEHVVADQLKQMNLIRDFEIRPTMKDRKEPEVRVRTHPRLPAVHLVDVGFGVSQVLPVIVECFYVGPRSIVIFEQPELHLHPSVEGALADLFVIAIRAREDGRLRHCQFIIKSHSEHFLRRLQRRIAEGELAPKEASLYVVQMRGQEAQLELLELDDYGNIRNWPENFFGDEMEDLVARSEAQARRMEQKVTP